MTSNVRSDLHHLLVIPLNTGVFNLCHQLADRHGFTITILMAYPDLQAMAYLVSSSPSIFPLIIQSIRSPDLPVITPHTHYDNLLHVSTSLSQSLFQWCRTHPTPPAAVFSDFFTSNWTVPLARALGIPRLSLSPFGAFGLSAMYRSIRSANSQSDDDPAVTFIRRISLFDAESAGFIINTFSELEARHIEQLMADLGRGRSRIWAVGPFVSSEVNQATEDVARNWLNRFHENSVIYICFGVHMTPSAAQAEAIYFALAISGVPFLWFTSQETRIPATNETTMAARGLVIMELAPQVAILGHAAVGWFMTNCGWKSTIEAVVAGVPTLTWPQRMDQFENARVMEQAGVARRVAEGRDTVPDARNLASRFRAAVGGREGGERRRAAELREIARRAVADGGSSFQNLETLANELKSLR